ncbi:NAD-dependent epimerase/dehydratase family protein [Micromonospora sp. CPCC 206060]|uniref:NAD-dependent epimerase/dehydratase family protein n=1 Tax=Micromonospora sp. CPCC 206060 TaxID=3122406 RepID=UPI002FEEB5BC
MPVPPTARRVLVTGGAGFIGSNLVHRLDRAGWHTVVLDDFSTGRPENLAGSRAEVINGSVGDPAALARALDGVSAAVHLAAETSVLRSMAEPIGCHDRNVTASLHLLEEACRRDVHVVLASSAAVYGDREQLPLREDSPTTPVSPYGASKLAMEQYGNLYATTFRTRVLTLRFFNVFGPHQDAHGACPVVPRFVQAVLRGEPVTMFGTGKQSRDFVPVSFVTRVIHRAIEEGLTAPGPVNVGSGTATPIHRLAELVQEVTGRAVPVVHLPERPGEIHESYADVSLLHRLLPGLARISLRRELQATTRWLDAQSRRSPALSCHP